MLEEKLEKRRKMKMEKLQQKHENENKVVFIFSSYMFGKLEDKEMSNCECPHFSESKLRMLTARRKK